MKSEFKSGDRIVGSFGAHTLTADEVQRLNDGGKAVLLPDRVVIIDPEIMTKSVEGVSRAAMAFSELSKVSDDQITFFFRNFATRLEDDVCFAPVSDANAVDVRSAESRGRSIGRLQITAKMRREMVESARLWAESPVRKELVVEHVDHGSWSVDKVASPLGVVAFVFEGRPNVCVDATGVLRTGNTCVFRIGSDAIGTAQAIMQHCLVPALVEAGLPESSVVLLDESDRSSGFALFSDRRVCLAVARGSGSAVSDLGFVAQSHGISTSLHGTGGAWMIVGDSVDLDWFAETMKHSLDRKVCNTLNVCCVPRSRWNEIATVLVDQLERFSTSSKSPARLHVVGLRDEELDALRRDHIEIDGETESALATEWEWDVVPELFLVVTDSINAAFDLCNRYSPQFVVSVLTADAAEHESAWHVLNAPFVGNGFTRWVDGQYALGRPELGLSNWQSGRALGRGGILSGDDIRTFRYRMHQSDPTIHR